MMTVIDYESSPGSGCPGISCPRGPYCCAVRQLVVIMGPARTGKSTLARRIGTRLEAMWFSTDSLIWMLHRGAPEMRIPNDGLRPEEKSAGIEPFLVGFLENTTYNHGLTVVEGDAVLPRQLQMLEQRFGIAAVVALLNSDPQPDQLCVAGGWASALTKPELEEATRLLGDFSRRLAGWAGEMQIPSFDLTEFRSRDAMLSAAQESVEHQLGAGPPRGRDG